MRLVSLVCSNTEIVHALGLVSHLVGVDDHSDHPEGALAGLPRLGKELAIDVGRVAALEPDLVLASLSVPGHEKVVEALERAGLPLLVLDPTSLADVFRDIRTVGAALGVPERGEAVVRTMEETLADLGETVEAEDVRAGGCQAIARERPRVLVEWWPRPVIAPGRLSWVQDLLDLVGARNPLEAEDVRSRPIANDEVAAMAPDAIVVSWCGVKPSKYRPEVVLRNSLWREVPAVRHGQVHCVPEAFLGRPGPRLVQGAIALRRVVESVRGPRP